MIPPRGTMFSTPTWLRDLGFASWLLVGFVLIIIGVIWLLGESRVDLESVSPPLPGSIDSGRRNDRSAGGTPRPSRSARTVRLKLIAD